LSRESTTEASGALQSNDEDEDDDNTDRPDNHVVTGDDHTAGVGTRSYASPEQMSGSDYDSSTDIYSLGIILFEMCYRMTTGMERNICLSRLRKMTFPDDWDSSVGASFTTLRELITNMVSPNPPERPTASSVARHIQSLFEFTILDERRHRGRSGVLLLRVEAERRDNALARTLDAIQEASTSLMSLETPSVDNGDDNEQQQKRGPAQVLQYGLCNSEDEDDDRMSPNEPAIMEFALKYEGCGSELADKLLQRPEIFKVRQVSTGNGSNRKNSSA